MGSVQVDQEIIKGVDSTFSITNNPNPNMEVSVIKKLQNWWESRRRVRLYRRMGRELDRSLRAHAPINLVLWRRR